MEFQRSINSTFEFKLPTLPDTQAVKKDKNRQWLLLVDFGKETFGFIKLHGLKGKGKVTLYYGESKEEALSTDHCEHLIDWKYR